MQEKPNRTVRCVYCGREFIEPIPHRCNKNYRKRNLKWINIMEEERRQFNASEFISNKETPVETRDGRKVEIFTTTRETESAFVVVGTVGTTKEDYSYCEYDLWTKEGKFSSPSSENNSDLFFSLKKKTRRMTNQELAWWLRDCPEEHREFRFKVDTSVFCVLSTYTYIETSRNCPCEEGIRIRSNGEEWREPEIEVKEENDKRD